MKRTVLLDTSVRNPTKYRRFDAIGAMPTAPINRSRFTFSLRTLLVLVTIIGSFLGYLAIQLQWIRDRSEAKRWLIDTRARQLARDSGIIMPPRKGTYLSRSEKAPWILRILGEGGVERLEVEPAWLNSDSRYSIDELQLLFPEATVRTARVRQTERRQGEWLLAFPLAKSPYNQPPTIDPESHCSNGN